ncbi:MAG: hypothetical protein JO174_03325 [Herbaspirillum sp.]|nr:hypothetical protein [Herbaspirillum sp.]
MVEKVRIKGDVGQIFNGNVINEAPQLSNVLNVNVPGDNKRIETLTQLQRRTIADLIDELCVMTGEEPLAVYRIILADFGVAKMKLMPREEYPRVKKKISQWIVDVKKRKGLIWTEPETLPYETPSEYALRSRTSAIAAGIFQAGTVREVDSSVNTVSNPERALRHAVNPKDPRECAVCAAKNVFFISARKTIRTLGTLVISLSVLCAWLLYQMPPSGQNMTSGNCYFEGQPYSVGSLIKTGNGLLKECMSTSPGSAAKWGSGT